MHEHGYHFAITQLAVANCEGEGVGAGVGGGESGVDVGGRAEADVLLAGLAPNEAELVAVGVVAERAVERYLGFGGDGGAVRVRMDDDAGDGRLVGGDYFQYQYVAISKLAVANCEGEGVGARGGGGEAGVNAGGGAEADILAIGFAPGVTEYVAFGVAAGGAVERYLGGSGNGAAGLVENYADERGGSFVDVEHAKIEVELVVEAAGVGYAQAQLVDVVAVAIGGVFVVGGAGEAKIGAIQAEEVAVGAADYAKAQGIVSVRVFGGGSVDYTGGVFIGAGRGRAGEDGSAVRWGYVQLYYCAIGKLAIADAEGEGVSASAGGGEGGAGAIDVDEADILAARLPPGVSQVVAIRVAAGRAAEDYLGFGGEDGGLRVGADADASRGRAVILEYPSSTTALSVSSPSLTVRVKV